VSIWIAAFTLAYLARIASGSAAVAIATDGADVEQRAPRAARSASRGGLVPRAEP
jgi:hypothetical protein